MNRHFSQPKLNSTTCTSSDALERKYGIQEIELFNAKRHETQKFIQPIQWDFYACFLVTIGAISGFIFETAYGKFDSRSNNLFLAFALTATRLEKVDSLSFYLPVLVHP